MIDPSPVKLSAKGDVRMSPTQRTLKFLTDLGYRVGIVERRIPGRNITLDLFGIIDMIALTPEGVMGVQSTGQDFAGHLRKITEQRAVDVAYWLRTPGTSLMLIGWRKVKGKGKGKGNQGQDVWAPRVQMIGLDHIEETLTRLGRKDLLRSLTERG